MPRYKLTIEYDGRGYRGWQKQEGLPTVQQTVEDALAILYPARPQLCVAGRTDAGVHARGQVAHVDLEKALETWVLRQALNAHLRETRISIMSVEEVDPDFHARFQAVSKTYIYEVINRRPPLTFQEGLAWHVPRALSLDAMREAGQHLLGHHDFTSFRGAGCQALSPMKTMDVVVIEGSADLVRFRFEAKSFLYHQVRNMVGALVDVGVGRWAPQHIKTILDQQKRCHGGVTAPADGLYLEKITYTTDFNKTLTK